MGVTEVQVFVSLLVVLGAAFVALLCDLLKGNNEQLRESNVALRTRQSERELREKLLLQVQKDAFEAVSRIQQKLERLVPVEPPAQAPEPEVARQRIRKRPKVQAPAPEEPSADPVAGEDVVKIKVVEEEQAPPLCGTQEMPVKAAAPSSRILEPKPAQAVADAAPALPSHKAAPVAPPAPAPETPSNVVELPVFTTAWRATRSAGGAQTPLQVPGGYHEATALARLLEEDAVFHGLSVVLSVVDYVKLMAEQGKPATEQLMAQVSRLVMSLTRECDFSCRIAEDEYVVIFPGETGAGAKRRLQTVSEQLWEFQLRAMGSFAVIFSWGASESDGLPLVLSVEAAREQMLETRRNRKALAAGAGRVRRRAVND